ncbi:MAG: TIGR00296 family protein [Candidatus Bathyarchaeota archaeon]|nr:TIGR00296 family protein [Candidatus Termiticorpusculum sp.]
MSFELTDEDGKVLVKLARSAVETFLEKGQTIKSPKDVLQKFYEKCGVFVTINTFKDGEKTLRGCIGYPYPMIQLIDAVIDSAINAATEDPRFSPMSFDELDKCVFEVSVLTPPEQVQVSNPKKYVQQIKVGQDGLVIERGYNKGLLLPQVPVEWQWCEEEFLCQCCMKAGLPPDSWLTKDTKIYKFTAIIFEEQTPNGEIKRLSLNQ